MKPRKSLADRVYHSLFSRISNGDYLANQKLPPENTLSQEFGVSRPVLRTALERLREEGLVYSRQGAGNYVRAPQSTPVGFARVETLADIQRCYEFRLNLETKAAGLAAERYNPPVLAEIEEALELLRDATGSHQHREDADFDFHLAISKASNNQYFEATLRALRDHVNVGMTLHGQTLMRDGAKSLQEVLEEHAAIFTAIRERRPADASRLMQAHLEHSRDRLFGGGLIDLSMK
ncbi:GntR family transcriptional regulator [Breoghania corrubedonensis]|uniref:GntR family transcriptional regulator n=1 Tax=Breoghania corrubedonensis TaxID=665038 RepID=A0A2T5VHI1_9HYPH|nr:FadR/GntR family transcriptional regulator [Breoghania corrubedonensis]PTW63203.1 GntR family transcriptional regulator [Breoghania corrubedonensis]